MTVVIRASSLTAPPVVVIRSASLVVTQQTSSSVIIRGASLTTPAVSSGRVIIRSASLTTGRAPRVTQTIFVDGQWLPYIDYLWLPDPA